MAALQKMAGDELMRQLRKTANTELKVYAPCISEITEKTLPHTLSDLGITGKHQQALLSRKSVFFRYQFTFWAQVFQYLTGSTNLQLSNKKLLNDLVDSDYVITASYCDRLETADKKLRQRYDALIESMKGA